MLGIIGGSGLYELDEVEVIKKHSVDTPFGNPSTEIIEGSLNNRAVFFLPRHGTQHELLPSEINYRANIFALKSLGAKAIVSVSAVGSLQEDIRPGDFVLANQFVDFTKKRENSFFGNGLVAHVASAQPTCSLLEAQITKHLEAIHSGKTYVCIEGPRFGTKAESAMFRKMDCDVIGMTNVPEVFLALEAQIAYASLCIVTDYDCWKESEEVSVESAFAVYKERVGFVKSILRDLIANFDIDVFEKSPMRNSLKTAVLTSEQSLSDHSKDLLRILEF